MLCITLNFLANALCRRVESKPLYNDVLSETLPNHGIQCRIVPRKHLSDDRVISASAVRQAIHDGCLEEVADMLPETTLNYFRSPEATPIIAAIRREKDVVHY